MTAPPLAVIAGAGPGLGRSLMNACVAHGYRTVGLGRSAPDGGSTPGNGSAPDSGADRNGARSVRCDLSDEADVEATVKALVEAHGPPRLVVHNPAHLIIKPFLDTPRADFVDSWQAMVLSAVTLAQAVLPHMAEAGAGTFIVSGATASLRGGRNFSAFASAKFALRGLTQSLAREFQPQGIHVVHACLDGIIDTPASRALHSLDPARMMKADAIAAEYLRLAQQDPSVWSHETDLRPQSEAF